MVKQVTRTEVDTRPEVKQPKDVEVVEDALDALVRKVKEEFGGKPVKAQFFSNYAEHIVGLKPHEQTLVNGRIVDLPGSNDEVRFHNRTAIVDGDKRIKKMMRHPRFRLDFFPDSRDSTGFWEKAGVVKKKKVEHTVIEMDESLLEKKKPEG
jgi:hypothetical protein